MSDMYDLREALDTLKEDGKLVVIVYPPKMPMREHVVRSLIAGVCLAAGMVGALLLIQNIALYFGN